MGASGFTLVPVPAFYPAFTKAINFIMRDIIGKSYLVGRKFIET
jgi:hypothetical protein